MFVIASVDSFSYKLLFLLHILSIVVAFSPAFVNPVLNARLKSQQSSLGQFPKIAGVLARNTQQIYGPALVLAGLFGIGLIGSSSSAYEFSQAWVSIAFVLWIALVAVVFAFIGPAERKVAEGDASAEKLASMFGGIAHLLFILMLIDMIWKPGL